MIRVLTINLGNYGSTGGIVYNLKKIGKTNEIMLKECFPDNKGENKSLLLDDYVISNDFYRRVNHKIAELSGFLGCTSIISTFRLIKEIINFDPNIIHLHNLHGDYINIPILFRFLRKSDISVIWTLHDCWAFTGRCPHFQLTGCEKWINGCDDCIYPKEYYPESYIDHTKYLWNMKKKYFTSLKKLYIVTPSKWLRKLVQRSFLNKYPVDVIYNGINTDIFKPTYSEDIAKRINKGNRKMILGVALGWKYSKGIDVFEYISQRLDDSYLLVLVGGGSFTNYSFGNNVVIIERTKEQKDLAVLYTLADVFVNPTREEVFGLVNVEALACGTPVLTYKTGGCPEIIDNTCGCIVNVDDNDALIQEIEKTVNTKRFSKEACIKRAQYFKQELLYDQYIQLYKKVAEENEE